MKCKICGKPSKQEGATCFDSYCQEASTKENMARLTRKGAKRDRLFAEAAEAAQYAAKLREMDGD